MEFGKVFSSPEIIINKVLKSLLLLYAYEQKIMFILQIGKFFFQDFCRKL